MSQLKEYFNYRKFAAGQKRILFLDKGYFLQQESMACLREMGHVVYPLKVADEAKVMLERLLKSCVEFKPDAILGMNHFGLDAQGKISALLNELNIPVIFWYLDDFRFIIQQAEHLTRPNVLLFTFEKEDVPELKELGFEHVFYLPTASALDLNKNYRNTEFSYLREAVSYVGSSFEPTKKQWLRPGYEEKLAQLNLAQYFAQQGLSVVDFVLREQAHLFRSKDEVYHYAGYVSAQATQDYRVRILKNVSHENVHIFGDDKWRDLGLAAQVHPAVHNLQAAPSVFANSQINLNISSCQLKSGVNLRLYDIPAAGGFLLTDWKESVSGLFELDKEVVVYRSVEELNELIVFYSRHPEQRNKIIKNAGERIAAEHLLRHRLQAILEKAALVYKDY